jgi:DNA-binding response OmpR family regulator
MLTALGTTEDKVNGLDAGADDYLVKPFEFQELLARIKALTRRGSDVSQSNNILKGYDLELDLDRKRAVRGGKIISLTAKEFGLLEFLMRSNGRVVAKDEIAEKVWDVNFDTGTNFVEVYINLLRKKVDKDFEKKLIHTRFGLGYCFTDNP